MTPDLFAYSPESPVTAGDLVAWLAHAGWVVACREPDGRTLAPDERIDDGDEVVVEGTADVCELSVSTGRDLSEDLESLLDDAGPDIAERLRAARTGYGIHPRGRRRTETSARLRRELALALARGGVTCDDEARFAL